MLAAEIIRTKRDGGILTTEQLNAFVLGMVNGEIADSQQAAFAMAVYFNGLNASECADLTLAMRDSGRVIDWRSTLHDAPVIDKHSTGGVGDNVSLMLAPMLAACGVYVPMISGRGLGFTGGTLDKLDALPGYQSQIDTTRFKSVVKDVGCAIVGANPTLAPADAQLYAVRDITATVDSEALIVSSILSKKLAAGVNALILDVKTGSGATLPAYNDSVALAQSLVSTANAAGLNTSALITDMNQPLASVAGNALEVRDAISYLKGNTSNHRQHELVLTLGARLLHQASVTTSVESAREKLIQCLDDGSAAQRFANMVRALGVQADVLEDTRQSLPVSAISAVVSPTEPGIVTHIDTRKLGLCIVALGGGRQRADSALDYSTGLSEIAPIGTAVDNHHGLAIVHAQNPEQLQSVLSKVREAFTIGETAVDVGPVVIERVTRRMKPQ